jgi:hypothetical protein
MATLIADPPVTGRALYCVNQVLQRNERILWIVISMALGIFILGISLLLIGIITKDWRILAPSSIITGLLYWPINMIHKMRVENMVLLLAIALVPVESLPPEKAAEQIGKVIDRILKYDEKRR